MKRPPFSRTRVHRKHWLKGGSGSMYEHNGVMRPACWFRMQLRVADLMSRVGRQRTQIRKDQP